MLAAGVDLYFIAVGALADSAFEQQFREAAEASAGELIAEGVLAVEIKNRPRLGRGDASSIERSRRILADRYRGGLVVYRGPAVVKLTETVYGVPDWLLLGA